MKEELDLAEEYREQTKKECIKELNQITSDLILTINKLKEVL